MHPTSILLHRLLAPLEPLIVRLLEQLFELFTILFIKIEGFDDGDAIERDPNSSHEYYQANPINHVGVKFSHHLSNSEGWMLAQFLLVPPIDYEIEVGVGVGNPLSWKNGLILMVFYNSSILREVNFPGF